MSFSHAFCRALLATVLVLSITAAPATAQSCGMVDDGLTVAGACCVPVQSTLPQFPNMTILGEGACFRNCNLEMTWSVNLQISAPIPIFCDLYAAPFSIGSNITPTNNTFMLMKYARTWTEIDATGLSRQVWRFLVNADVTYTPTPIAGIPCPIPPSTGMATGLNRPVHFLGSIDYALDCATGNWSAAVNLTHLCGAFMHNSASAVPLPAPESHPDRTYCFVGPLPFTWGGVPNPPAGMSVADTQRSTLADLTGPAFLWQCFSENEIRNGLLNTAAQDCPCSDPTLPASPQFSHQTLQFDIACGPGTVPIPAQSIPIPPLLPTGLTGFNIGQWGTPVGTFPGDEQVTVYFGVMTAPDPCALVFTWPFHVVSGVGTTKGDLGVLFPGPSGLTVTTDQFLDLHNMLRADPFTSALTPGFGGLFLSTQVWCLNF